MKVVANLGKSLSAIFINKKRKIPLESISLKESRSILRYLIFENLKSKQQSYPERK